MQGPVKVVCPHYFTQSFYRYYGLPQFADQRPEDSGPGESPESALWGSEKEKEADGSDDGSILVLIGRGVTAEKGLQAQALLLP